MKSSAFVALALVHLATASAEAVNPLSTTIALLDDLTAKVTSDGAAAEKAAADYAKWCTSTITDLGFDIETGESSKVELEATITKMTANIVATSSKIDELGASVSKDDAELKDAEAVRAAEKADFLASEKELVDSIDALSRATGILEKEMSKNPAALLQMDTADVTKMVQSLGAVVSAAGFSSVDQQRLVALVQAQQGSDDSDEELAAPAAAAYKTHSTSIFDVLEDLKEKAEAELSDLRKAEASAAHEFAMLKQGLEDSIDADSKRLTESKTSKMSFSQTKAVAKGDLSQTVKGLIHDKETLKSTDVKCKQVAAEHEASMKARAEELAAVAEAKKVLSETTVGAEKQTYSFLQVRKSKRLSSQLQSHAASASSEVVTLVKKLAKEHHSAALAQLASRIATVFRYGEGTGEDPFVKVKSLISDLIAKLEKEASSEATEKAFCDEELAKTKAKKSDLSTEIDSLTSKIDMATARSAKLKGEAKQLQAELAALAKSQAEADRIRSEQHADYVTAKKDLELGLLGVRKALTVLRDFYGGASFMQQPAAPESYSKGAGGSIVDILEVVESDFAKNLATEETEESDAASAYEEMTQNNKVTTAAKSQDVKYKEKEFKALDKAIVDTSSDKDSTSTELAAVLDYEGKLTERCVAKPETYEERKARRSAEIAGLKEALSILESETAFMQSRKRGRRSHRQSFLSNSEPES